MILKVNKDICEIKQNEVWNVGDYNVHTVQVELSEEFDGLVNKVRYFTEDNSYDMLITDNIAGVPYEATLTEGTIKIGVYGYDADTNILVQSTSPVNKYITSGTYTGEADNTEPLTPTDKEQMETAIQKNTNDITDLKENKQDKLISGVNIKTINNESILSSGNLTLVTEETDPIFTNSPAYSITDNDITYWNNKANMSDIPDVSNFITKDVDDLTYYTKSTDMQTAINNAVGNERTARENADNSLQNQIDAITVSSDVVDVVSTYQDLVDYDTQHIKANDIIKVMQDSTHDNAISYYRWVIVNHVGSWVYVGSEGPYYTKSETDTLLNAKQNTITTTNKLASDLVDDTNQTNLFVTSTEKTTWNNKLDQSDLNDYVKNTDYATTNVAGVLKPSAALLVNSSNGNAYCEERTYAQYQSSGGTEFISKGTLENVITGKNLETANNKVTSISSSSTDVQYPSAKCVYDNDVIIKDDVNTKYDYLFSLTNLFEKITGTGTSITLNDTSNTIMKLNLDTTTSSQEDTPSPSNPQTVHTITGDNEIDIVGKNLFDGEIELGTIIGTTGEDSDSTNRIRSSNYVSVNNSTQYTLSAKNINTSKTMQGFIFEYDKNNTFIQRIPSEWQPLPITFTTSLTTKNIRVLLSYTDTSTTNVSDFYDLQIEKGSTATEYTPYKNPQEYPINLGDIELCKIGDYKDVLFKNTLNSEYYNNSLELNKWYKLNNIGKVVLDGSENWSRNDVNEVFVLVFENYNTEYNIPYSNYYMGQSIVTAYNQVINNSVALLSSGTRLFIKNTSITTAANFKSWLSTHNTTLYYVLETPTYTLLNDTLQTQLNNIQYTLAYDTQTNISQTNTDLPFIINAETYKEINLADYVKNTDYASTNKGGVVKANNYYNANISSNSGTLFCDTNTYVQYERKEDNSFISKGTLENVVAGKELDLKQLSTFDRTKTQVLKNINGTLTWVDES